MTAPTLSVGDHVSPSDRLLARGGMQARRYRDATGVVLGFHKDGVHIRVQWDVRESAGYFEAEDLVKVAA
jgi:ribosomal protein L21E